MSEIKKIAAVVYTDGGCNPNDGNGYMGSGVHGYLYEHEVALPKPGKAKLATTTHGYLDREILNKRLTTETILEIKPTLFIESVQSYADLGTNNIAEMSAVIAVLDQLTKLPGMTSIRIMMDSEYVRLGLLERCAVWQRNNWLKRDGEPPKNVDLWKRLYALYIGAVQSGIQIELEWVKGHSGLFGNMLADFLAGMGVRRSEVKDARLDFQLLLPKAYQESETERNPLFAYRRLYFNSLKENHVPGTYYMSAPGKLKVEAMEGRRVTDSVFGVVRLHTPDRILETVIDRHAAVYARYPTQIIRVDLDRLYSKTVLPIVDRFGGMSLVASRLRSTDLIFDFDKDPITEPQDPIGMTMQAINAMTFMEKLLVWYSDPATGDDEVKVLKPTVQDITERFYERTETKKGEIWSLRKEITSNLTHIDVKIARDDLDKEMTAKVLMALDVLPRNNLKRLEGSDIRVCLISWKDSELVARYATIIECSEGIGIWSNYHTNKLYVH